MPLRLLPVPLLLVLAACDATEPDEDGDGVVASLDCDDADDTVYPDAEELCDGVDNDCNGLTDDAPSDGQTWYRDRDGDGYGDPDESTLACTAPELYVEDNTDCDDLAPNTSPGQEEVCDGVDNDCNGEADEATATDASTWYADSDNDGYGDPDASATACVAPDGYLADATDCDDNNAGAYPGAKELCVDNIDTDCDGLPDAEDEDACRTFTGWPEASHELENVADRAIRGSVVSYVGITMTFIDLDLDGVDDLVVSTRGEGAALGFLSTTLRGGGPLKVADADYTFQGTPGITPTVANIGDMTGDGFDDLALGVDDIRGTRAGDVYVFASENWTPAMELAEADVQFSGADNDSRYGPLFGWHVSGAGDVDGDGLADLLVGGRAQEVDGQIYAGAAWVFLSASIDDTLMYSAEADYRFDGLERNHAVGWALGSGDIDGGERSDIVVGSLGSWGNPVGDVYVFLGENLASADVFSVAEADLIIKPHDPEDGLGHQLSVGGDFDGDGLSDLLLAAPWADEGAEKSGAVYLFLGESLAGKTTVSVEEADYTFTSDSAGAQIDVVTTLGDLDGDGRDELAIGTDELNGIAVFAGGSLGDETMRDLSSADYLIQGTDENVVAGLRSLASGDLDADGKGDLAVGLPVLGNEVRLFLGADLPSAADITDAAQTIHGTNGTSGIGWDVSNVGDMDGDFVDDLMVGTNGLRSCLFFSSTPRGASSVMEDADYCFEGNIRWADSAGDLDGDGIPDLMFHLYDPGSPAEVALLFGASLGSASQITIRDEADYLLLGTYDNELVGSDMGSAGDIDGDGRDDLYMSTADNGCACDEGVFVVFASSLGDAREISILDADVFIDANRRLSSDFSVVSGKGDLDGDDLADLLISTDGAQVFLGSSITAGGTFSISDADLTLADDTNELTWVSDMDGDGRSEVATTYRGTAAGQALLYLSSSLADLTSRSAAEADVTFSGGASSFSDDWAYDKVENVGDVDGDGIPDLLFGSPYDDTAADNAGRAVLYFGSQLLASSELSLDDAAYTFLGTFDGLQAGWGLEGGDFNGDGLSDLIVSGYAAENGIVYELYAP